MERPSHNNFRISHSPSSRLPSVGLAISLPFAILWALAHHNVVQTFISPDLIVDRTIEKVRPLPPPSLPPLTPVTPITAVLPDIVIDQTQKDDHGVVALRPPVSPKPDVTPAVTPDRAAAGIASTHTTPLYPLLSRRLGEEGTVTLRLAVQADGHVGAAEIITSSGSRRLDEAAREWVVAHWLYKPALVQGQPAASQVTASVIFSLKDQP